MIETSSLGNAVGIQRGDVIDRTEGTQLPRLGTGVIIGKFKRGRVGKVFVVNRDNYQAILGHDPSNPSYQAVEDALARGAANIKVLRTGASGGSAGGGNGTPSIDFESLPLNNTVAMNNSQDSYNHTGAYFSIEINGVMYNADKSQDLISGALPPELYSLVQIYSDSSNNLYFSSVASNNNLNIRLSPSADQKLYSNMYHIGDGTIQPDGTFIFRLQAAAEELEPETPLITPTALSTVFTVLGTAGNGFITLIGNSTAANWRLVKNGVLVADADGFRSVDVEVVGFTPSGILEIKIPVDGGTNNTYMLDIDCYSLFLSDRDSPDGGIAGNVNITQLGSGLYSPTEYSFTQYTYQTPF